ncbi:MAG TPA: HK97 family phage prohead protease [Blastocatellia bacterium]|nr:HK97 family phage prohead protease [Blastocatellia bacterium]
MEYKALPTYLKAVQGRTVTGIFAVHGNLDSYGDISHPGSFAKTIAERGAKTKFLWNHDYYSVPVAVVKRLREVRRDELPERVLHIAPEATGGVEIVREYLDTPRADEVYKSVIAGAVTEMSYGYDAVKYDFGEVNGQRVRHLREVRLWEVSDCIFGANPATSASKSFDQILHYVSHCVEEFQAGRDINSLLPRLRQLRGLLAGLKLDEQPKRQESRAGSAAYADAPLTQCLMTLRELELTLIQEESI